MEGKGLDSTASCFDQCECELWLCYRLQAVSNWWFVKLLDAE